MRVDFQNDRYTVGGKDIFDNLADLVEHFKRTGIEELSGTMVYLKQVRKFCNECFFFFSYQHICQQKHVQQKHQQLISYWY